MAINRTPTLNAPRYQVIGQADGTGTYNSHLIFVVLLAASATFNWIPLWVAALATSCFVGGFLIDRRRLADKVNLSVIPKQSWLYACVFVQVLRDAALPYALAFALYIFSAPILRSFHVSPNSFVLLYGAYLLFRTACLLKFSAQLLLRPHETPESILGKQKANLSTRNKALSHLFWAYFIGNVGLIVRCSAQVLTLALFDFCIRALNFNLDRFEWYQSNMLLIAIIAVVAWGLMIRWGFQRAALIYYRTHRTLHEERALYDCIHAIHHRAVYPTLLDSGTISPAEFALTELVFPAATIVPNWCWVMGQIGLGIVGHWPSHDSRNVSAAAKHHLLHHQHFKCNFGLTAELDIAFGTQFVDRS